MPNIKSAIKRVDVINKKTAENKMIKSEVATFIKKFKSAVASGELDSAEKLLSETVSVIDSAASKGVLHKNNASRKQARLQKLLNDAKNK